MTCPIPNCPFQVVGPLRICAAHYKLMPRPQQDALNHYARTRKGGPSHIGAFERAVESVQKTLVGRTRPPVREVSLPYRDD
jgi:hypothetical protein